MALMKVFYEDWQMECCGRRFGVGQEVGWRIVRYAEDGAGRDGDRYGAEAWVENHGGPRHPTPGRVRAIELVSQDYTIHPDRGGTFLEPVPGTRTLESVGTCPKWFGERETGPRRLRRVVGALVTLEVDGSEDATPHPPGDRS
ncbi:hypothetical protein AQJ66_11855 [Streptomyces bungoensis]|uniref:Uncharacterized protein n=1 Tax=Streptomyces bungoensis TaxID=285568 RepID=A0A117RE75_9ACTN|nr:DUF6578 domain-containing protein [Streptomyces bungoensis]KUN85933.1 hypothetical protein AQJ66_11855 [Streptomyces bungoensis]